MTARIPFTDLGAMADQVWPEVLESLNQAVPAARFIGGAAVEQFEADWARYCGTTHAVGVANGTDALHLTLRALGIGPGDEVVVPAMTFVATAEAVALTGAVPRFADVDPQTLLMTAETMEAALTPRTRAVIPVHLYGQPADMDTLCRVAHQRGLFVLEDAAQAHGARWRSRTVGSFGDAACFSFYPGKNLGAFGDAGAVVTQDGSLAERVRSLANHGRDQGSHHLHTAIGTTSRLDALQALVLQVKMGRLPDWTEARRKLALRYREGLQALPGVELIEEHPHVYHVYHLFVVRVADRDQVRAELSEKGVETGIHYPLPCHRQPGLAQFATEPLHSSETAAAEILSLPMYPDLGLEQVDRVIELMSDVTPERERNSSPRDSSSR